jgi:hypothetical protein
LISLGPGEPPGSPVDTLSGYVPDAELFKDHAGSGLLQVSEVSGNRNGVQARAGGFVPVRGTATALSELPVARRPQRKREQWSQQVFKRRKGTIMATCTEKHHADHAHKHGPKCGHTAVRHDGHVDYLHDGHLHHMHEDHVDEHVIAVNATNPVNCTPEVHCSHAHGPNCGHEEVPHGDHVDYLVNGRLHHPHGDHCDDHGPVQLA